MSHRPAVTPLRVAVVVTLLLASLGVGAAVLAPRLAGREPRADAQRTDGLPGGAEVSTPAGGRAPRRPGPELEAGDVVQIVMAALRDNDAATDGGIVTAFHFASPDNQAATGPIERFVPMVKSPGYAPMLNHRAAAYGPLVVRAGLAQQVVTVTDAEGGEAAYLFRLSRHPASPEGGPGGPRCWRTDGVIRLRPGAEPPPLPEPQFGEPASGERSGAA